MNGKKKNKEQEMNELAPRVAAHIKGLFASTPSSPQKSRKIIDKREVEKDAVNVLRKIVTGATAGSRFGPVGAAWGIGSGIFDAAQGNIRNALGYSPNTKGLSLDRRQNSYLGLPHALLTYTHPLSAIANERR